MILDKLFEDFIDDIQREGTYATSEEVREVTFEMLRLLKENKDSTPEEIVDMVIQNNIELIKRIKDSYPIPGYTIGVNVGNINIKLFGGDIDCFQRKMPEDALFDIASMTKFYTQIIAYNLINEGVFSFSDKVKDLDQRFQNVGDLTVGEVLQFAAEFRTDGRLSSKATIEEALNCLYEVKVLSTGSYNYNDMGMMLTKELMEHVTGKSYSSLVDEYIVKKLGLLDTHLIVPTQKIDRITGSANARFGMPNDPSALSVGGYSGHAGMFASSDDLIKLGRAVSSGNVIPEKMLKDTYTPGIKENRGIMGTTYTSHPTGVNKSYVDRLEPIRNFAIQGSTRTQMNVGKDFVSTILLNPASMDLERARYEEAKINEARSLKGQPPLSLVKRFQFDRNGNAVEYNLVDARLMSPSGKTVEPLTTENAKLALRLRFLNKVIAEYDRNYTKEINISKKL